MKPKVGPDATGGLKRDIPDEPLEFGSEKTFLTSVNLG